MIDEISVHLEDPFLLYQEIDIVASKLESSVCQILLGPLPSCLFSCV